MNRLAPGMLVVVSVALTAQVAIASRAAESPAAHAGAVKAAHDAAAAGKPVAKAVVPPKRASSGKAAVAAKPISAWRAAYLAKHHHEPPVKAK